jgi:hypothetical protein
MRVPIRAALVLATAATTVTLAACGTFATARPTSGPSAHSGAIKPASVIPGPPAGSRAEAAALASTMLARLRLPVGAHHLPGAPVPLSLSQPGLMAGAAASLDVYKLFVLPQTMGAAAAALAAHVPAGLILTSTGGPGVGSDGTTSQDVGYSVRSVPAGVYAAQLVLTLTPTATGGSLLRADAQVTWYPPRTAAEYIDPARYHVLSIAVTTFNPRRHIIHRIVTSQAAISQLAVALDRSQVNPVTTISCPMTFAAYRMTFAVSWQGAPAIVINASEWPCEGAQVSVGAQKQPPLQDAATVVAIAVRLLGVTSRP